MSFLIRNLTAADIEINDLGLTIEVGIDLDLLPETANSIAISDELVARITAGDVQVLDPLDGVTLLTKSDSLKVVSLANDPHFGIQGGKLNQIDDVNAPSPTHDYVLAYNSVSGKWEPKQSQGGSAPDQCFPFYLSDGTSDFIPVNSGLFPFYLADGSYEPIIIGGCN